MSATSTASNVYHQALWMNAMLGLRIKPVPGYKSVEKDAALLQGEVMLTIGDPIRPTRRCSRRPGVDVVMRD